MDGPLAPFATGLEEALVAEGYSEQRTRLLVGLASEVSHWLEAGGLRPGDLTGEVIDEFFAGRGPSRSRCRTARSLQPIVAYLRSITADDRTPRSGGHRKIGRVAQDRRSGSVSTLQETPSKALCRSW